MGNNEHQTSSLDILLCVGFAARKALVLCSLVAFQCQKEGARSTLIIYIQFKINFVTHVDDFCHYLNTY